MSEKKLGVITHYFDHLKVGIIKVSSPIKVGDKVYIKGHTTDFKQEITEIQLEHESIETAKKGQEVGIKVKKIVREGDQVLAAE